MVKAKMPQGIFNNQIHLGHLATPDPDVNEIVTRKICTWIQEGTHRTILLQVEVRRLLAPLWRSSQKVGPNNVLKLT